MGEKKKFNFGGKKFSIGAIIAMIVGGLALAVLFAFLFGWIVMLLWNWLMPDIFGLKEITYWQGWGLVLLAGILVKGGWGSGGSSEKKKKEKSECEENADNPWHVIKSEIKKEIQKEMNKDSSCKEENTDMQSMDTSAESEKPDSTGEKRE